MAGIYLHIPFCRQACSYCNFHFSTSLTHKDEMVQAMVTEIALRRDYLGTDRIETVYFGGGTPSLLTEKDLGLLFEAIYKHFDFSVDAEITLEANPDDLTAEKVAILRRTPINRFSIGVQSFSDADLQFMRRVHRAEDALRAIRTVQDAGFAQITIDLIYGSPVTSHAQWERNLDTFFGLDIPHLSAYCLTVEEKTILWHQVRKGAAEPVSPEHAATQFDLLVALTAREGFEHYEISNFAKPGAYSRHNTSYWKGIPYLGIGPSAHSFSGGTRQWNTAHNMAYLKALAEGRVPFESEELTPAQQYNEYVMTGLRTMWGCDAAVLERLGFLSYFRKAAEPFLRQGYLTQDRETYRLTQQGKFLADGIASELFQVD